MHLLTGDTAMHRTNGLSRIGLSG